jgi:ABC-type branched-subunit amino acid transport system permease subunit
VTAYFKRTGNSWLAFIGVCLLIVLIIYLPRLFPSGYMINAMIDSVRWIIFALSFDLLAGHIGAVSLGHPVFFGLGAYVTAILGPMLGLGFVGRTVLSAVLMSLVALVAGIAFFRIRRVTFAIGTLGALIIAQLVVNNAYEITGGPLCVRGVARPQFLLPFSETALRITTPTQYYYLLLPLLFVTILIYFALTRSRIGRSFTAVREDEVRASAFGIFPLRYKLLAFAVGAGLVGALGSFQAQYITVVCPTDIALQLTTLLLIIVFVGGVGSMRGVIIGAIIFSSLPRILETQGAAAISPAYQQIAYGVILVVVMIFFPDGLDGLLTRTSARMRKRYRSWFPPEDKKDE